MLLPALAKAKAKGQGIMCMNNTKQLMLAWKIYIDDNNDVLPFAYANEGQPTAANFKFAWTHGLLDWSPGNQDNWNASNTLALGAIWKYTGPSERIYKCPADIYTVKPSSGPYKGTTIQRTRSNSMNAWCGMNEGNWTWYGGPEFRKYLKMSDFVTPGPSGTWVLVDEHPDSINDGFFCVNMNGYPNAGSTQLPDVPASYHNKACGFAFADGHSEIHRWKDARTSPKVTQKALASPASQPNNPDIVWLWEHTTKKYTDPL